MDKSTYCACGKPAKYIVWKSDELIGSCNKYKRCEEYDDLQERVEYYKQLFSDALETAERLSLYREGTPHYKAALQNLTALQEK